MHYKIRNTHESISLRKKLKESVSCVQKSEYINSRVTVLKSVQWAIPIFIRCHPLLRNLAISRGGGIQSTGNSKEGMNDSWKFQGIRKMVPGNWYQGDTNESQQGRIQQFIYVCQSDVTSHFCDDTFVGCPGYTHTSPVKF